MAIPTTIEQPDLPITNNAVPPSNNPAAGKLLPAQKQLFTASHGDMDICLYQGGLNCGKTWAATFLGLQLANKYPGSVGMITARQWSTLRDNVWPALQKHLDTLGLVRNKHYRMNLRDRRITFTNNSIIYFRPVGRSKSYLDIQASWIHVEKAAELTEECFQSLFGCLSQCLLSANQTPVPKRLFATSRAVAPTHWLTGYFGPERVQKRKHFRRITANSSENIFQAGGFLTLLENTLPPDKLAELTQGIHPLEQNPDFIMGGQQETMNQPPAMQQTKPDNKKNAKPAKHPHKHHKQHGTQQPKPEPAPKKTYRQPVWLEGLPVNPQGTQQKPLQSG